MNENVSPPEVRNCRNCNKVLLPTRKNYCSKVCNWAYQNSRWNMYCAQCGKVFMLPKGRRSHYRKAKDGTKTFCSKPCWVSWWHENAKVLRANKINQNNNVQ